MTAQHRIFYGSQDEQKPFKFFRCLLIMRRFWKQILKWDWKQYNLQIFFQEQKVLLALSSKCWCFAGVEVELHYSSWWIHWTAENSNVQLCSQMVTGWDVSCRLPAPQQSTGCYDWGKFGSVLVDDNKNNYSLLSHLELKSTRSVLRS